MNYRPEGVSEFGEPPKIYGVMKTDISRQGKQAASQVGASIEMGGKVSPEGSSNSLAAQPLTLATLQLLHSAIACSRFDQLQTCMLKAFLVSTR